MQAHFQISAREFTGCMQAVLDDAVGKAIASGSFLRWAGPAGVVFIIGAALNWSEDRLLHGVSWLIMVVCGFVIWRAFNRLQSGVMHSIVTEGGLYTQPTTVEIDPEKLVLSNRLGRSELLWTAIRSIEEADHYITVYVDNLAVCFIPKSAFSTEAEFQSFFDKARRWSGAASGPWARQRSST